MLLVLRPLVHLLLVKLPSLAQYQTNDRPEAENVLVMQQLSLGDQSSNKPERRKGKSCLLDKGG